MIDLGLDIAAITRPGRKAAPLAACVVRELEPADLALLQHDRGLEAAPIKKISERHHALARALCSGMSEAEAGAHVGYSPSRVSILKASPAFRELLDLYRESADAQFAEMHSMLSGLSKDAAIALRERLEDDPDALTSGQLMEILKLSADRTGFGPTSKQETTIRVDLGDRLAAARERARLAQQPKDITPREAE